MIDPNDLRPGVCIHAPEVFLNFAVRGPSTRNGVKLVHMEPDVQVAIAAFLAAGAPS